MAMTNFRAEDMPGAKKAAAPVAKKADKKVAPVAPKKAEKVEAPVVDEVIVDEVVETGGE